MRVTRGSLSKLIRFSFFDDLSIAVNYEADPTCFVIFLLAFLIVCYNKSEFAAAAARLSVAH